MKIALANVVLGLACVAWLVALRRDEARWRPAALYVPVLAYIGATAAAVVFSQDPAHSVTEVAELLTLAIVPVTVSLLDRRRWDMLLAALTVVAVASSAVGLWQYLGGASTLDLRLRGLANHYMTFSGWTLAVILLLVADLAFHPDRRRRWWSAPAVAVCTTALLLSLTRNAWVGLAAGLVLAAVLLRPRALILAPTLAVVLGAAVIAGAGPRGVVERALSIVDPRHPSNLDRLCMVGAGVAMAADHPLFGVGMGMVEPRYPEYRRPEAPRLRVPHLHSNPVQIAAERGLLGLAAYLAILTVFLLHSLQALRGRDNPAFAAVAGCLLAVVGLSVAGLFEYNWGDAEVWIVTLACLSTPFALVREAA